MRMITALCALALVLPNTPPDRNVVRDRVQAQTWVLVISGIGGEPRFSEQFLSWGKSVVDAAVAKYGVPAANVTFLAEKAGAAPVTGEARKENIEAALTELATRVGSDDLLFVVLIGHGSYRGEESSLNLPGPDISAADFAKLLEPIEARVAVANTSSASGEWAKVLSGPNRAIVTSTKSGMERNESVFGRYFVDALSQDVADTDKDGRISLLEAYVYARTEVVRFYEGEGRLLTEHAQIEDSGDGVPSVEAVAAGPEGALAARIFLGAGASGVAIPADASPELRALLARKAELEERLAALRARQPTMEAAQYEKELEALLLEIARNDQEIRRLRGGGGA